MARRDPLPAPFRPVQSPAGRRPAAPAPGRGGARTILSRTIRAVVLPGVVVVGLLGGAVRGAAQVEPDSAKALRLRRLLEASGSGALVAAEIERSIAVERERNTELPAGLWDAMAQRVRREIPSLLEELVRIYDRHFSREEVEAYVAFYESPAGRHLAADQAEILAESRQAGERWGRRLGTEVAQQWAQAPPYEPPAGSDVFAVAEGTWDWRNRGDSTCVVDPHTIAFSADRRTMVLTHRKPFKLVSGRTGTVTSYEVRSSTRSAIRGFITGETRLTDDGRPVVWDLVLTGPDAYRWHRTDWEEGAFTDEVVRCPVRGR